MNEQPKRRILIVEDEPAVRTVAVRVLHAFGFETCACATADEAVEVISNNRGFGAVLSDVAMPGALDGIALSARLHSWMPSLPVILMSGDADSLERARSAPRVGRVLAKPFAMADLVQAVRECLGSTDGGSAIA